MKKLINKMKGCTDLNTLKKLFKQFCENCGEAPDDAGLIDFDDFNDDDVIYNWVCDKHPELADSFKEKINHDTYYGAYMYALLSDEDDDFENELIHYIALYCIDNPESLEQLIDSLEKMYEDEDRSEE